ncbi:MAG: right-handed parallel beta-helix repeat-containing protein [Candidatus Sumerlaeia bacterium]|nr:right-handed parallel beta-helix repeat-containing protein [Candidatus Sumerlaeia bacterium]
MESVAKKCRRAFCRQGGKSSAAALMLTCVSLLFLSAAGPLFGAELKEAKKRPPAAASDIAAKPALSARSVSLDAAKFPSLQAALDALPDSGGIVTLPPGTFEITQPLVLSRPESRIEGAGASTHIINKNVTSQPAIIIRPPAYSAGKQNRLWRVQIGNFRVSGNPQSGDGVLLQGINEPYIHGLSVDHHGGNGISLIDCYEDPRIIGSIITYNGKAGLNIEACHDIVVSANQFEENQDALRCIDSFNLCMTGNNVDDHLRHGVVIENTYGSVLSGNMIEECNGTAVILDRDCYGITGSANVIAHELGGGVHLPDAWGCAVSANTFVIVHSDSVRVGPDSGRITITGNNFCNSHIGGKDKRPTEAKTPMAGDAGTGILLKSTSDIVISGNSFSGLTTPAVRAEGQCRRILVLGNVAADPRGAAVKAKAFDLGAALDSIVRDNLSP